MKILSQYVVKDFLKNLVYCLFALVGLMVVGNLFGNLDNIFSSWHAFLLFLKSTAKSLPKMFEILLHFSVLLATVLTFNRLSRSSELVAMKAAGLGMVQFVAPLLIVLIPISAFSYYNQNYLHPKLNSVTDVQKELFYTWTARGNQLYFFNRIYPNTQTIRHGYQFLWNESPLRLTQVFSFRTGKFQNEKWNLRRITKQEKIGDHWNFSKTPRGERTEQDFPNILQATNIDAHHTPFLELYGVIRQYEKQDEEVVIFLLEWYQKTAALFAPFLMVLVGAPLAQFNIRRGKVSGELMITILLGVIFWIGNEIFLIFGKSGTIPPYAAAWGANLLFLAVGIMLIRRAN